MNSENIEILHEDAHIIVCRKPAGIATQTARIGAPDMVSILKNHLAADPLRSPKKGRAPYLAVIHRLDQPVEGLLVFAKTPDAARSLNRQLTSAGFGKYYLAVVKGIPSPASGTLEDYMVKDARTNTSRVCTKDTPGAKAARLHYKLKEAYEDTSLVEIHLDTGRHHQIRVQMAHLGCPLAGDRKYGADKSTKENTEPLKLCAFQLDFKHPADGRKMNFTISPSSF